MAVSLEMQALYRTGRNRLSIRTLSFSFQRTDHALGVYIVIAGHTVLGVS